MEKVKWEKRREWGFFILAFITLIIGISALILGITTWNLQKATNPTTKPEITIELYDGSNFPIWELSSVSRHAYDDGHSLGFASLNFQVTNLGLKDADYINIEAKDLTREYGFKTGRVDYLGGLDDEFFKIEFGSNECGEAYRDAQSEGEEFDFDYAWDKCKEAGTNLTKATQVILLDPIYGNYEYRKNQEKQAIGRAHRLGQHNNIKVIRFIIENSIEEEIYVMNVDEDRKRNFSLEQKI